MPVGGMRVRPAGLRLKYPSPAVGVKKILSLSVVDREALRSHGAGEMALALVQITVEYLREMHHPTGAFAAIPRESGWTRRLPGAQVLVQVN